MLRSLFAGISGLRVNQTMLDVTGNNIANANTTGFKSSTTVFQDTLSQMMTGGTAANAERGGTNPVQIGLGVQIATTSTNFNQGSAQMTGRGTDLMLQGDGFFVVQRGNEQMYTRAGAFTFDETGTLVTNSGARVQGYGLDATGAPDYAAGLIDITLDGRDDVFDGMSTWFEREFPRQGNYTTVKTEGTALVAQGFDSGDPRIAVTTRWEVVTPPAGVAASLRVSTTDGALGPHRLRPRRHHRHHRPSF